MWGFIQLRKNAKIRRCWRSIRRSEAFKAQPKGRWNLGYFDTLPVEEYRRTFDLPETEVIEGEVVYRLLAESKRKKKGNPYAGKCIAIDAILDSNFKILEVTASEGVPY